MKAIIGDMCYPKSEALIIPSNTKGIMSRGRASRLLKDGLSGISKEAKRIAKENKVEVGQCFSTYPGRLNKRGIKKIYHAVIKRLQSDFTSIYNVRETLATTLETVCDDDMESVAICGIGIDPGDLDSKSIAIVIKKVCDKFDDRIIITIIDDDAVFINKINELLKEES